MFSLTLILIITGISVFFSCSMGDNITWFEYYRGAVIGLFISGVILQIINKQRRDQEAKKKNKTQ